MGESNCSVQTKELINDVPHYNRSDHYCVMNFDTKLKQRIPVAPVPSFSVV
jgi:hypothetical protein